MKLFQGVLGIINIERKKEQDIYQADVNELLVIYSDMVYKIALVQMKNPADADDVFQEVFLRLIEYKDRLQSQEHAKAWLIRVTINCSKKHYGTAWYRKTGPLTEEIRAEWDFNLENMDLLKAVGALPSDQRIVVHLYYYEGYSINEIAGIMDKKENTIKSHLHRARKALRIDLKGDNQ